MSEFHLCIKNELDFLQNWLSILSLDELDSNKIFENELDELADLFLSSYDNHSYEDNQYENDNNEDFLDEDNDDYEVKELDFNRDSFKLYTEGYINNLKYEDDYFRLSDEY